MTYTSFDQEKATNYLSDADRAPDSSLVVFNVQSYSIHDGPGIRTVVFLKGCPLRCRWCSNPESQRPNPEIGVIESRCIRCGRCIEACPSRAIVTDGEGRIITKRDACASCGTCEGVCPQGARHLYGSVTTVGELMQTVMRDTPFFMRSGGGVTLSGGEPTLQFEGCLQILEACKEKYIHTAIETCGYIVDRSRLMKLANLVDLFLFDVKCIDKERHRALTGVSNEVILANARALASARKNIIVRVPIIPGFNDNTAEMERVAAFAAELWGVTEVDLLPFHQLGRSKYQALDETYQMDDVTPIDPGRIADFKAIFESSGFHSKVSG